LRKSFPIEKDYLDIGYKPSLKADFDKYNKNNKNNFYDIDTLINSLQT